MPSSVPKSSSSPDTVSMGDHLDEYFNQKTPLVKEYIYDMVVHRFLAVGHVVTEAIPCVS
jgi:hypothetical protein